MSEETLKRLVEIIEEKLRSYSTYGEDEYGRSKEQAEYRQEISGNIAQAILDAGFVHRDEIIGNSGHDEPCYYCNEKCNNLAGNPSEWAVSLSHRDEPGKAKWHHVGCVTKRLVENNPDLVHIDDLEVVLDEERLSEFIHLDDKNKGSVQPLYEQDIFGHGFTINDHDFIKALAPQSKNIAKIKEKE